MSEQIDKTTWDRAKQIFEQEGRKDRVWGSVSKDGKTAFAFSERVGPAAPTIVPLSADERKPYIERAQAELNSEKDRS